MPPVEYPPAPPPIGSVADLSDEDRKQLRRRALILAAQAFATPGGQIGSALASAAGASQEGREEAIRTARQRQTHDYALKRHEAEESAQRRRQEVDERGKERNAEALFNVYERIKEEDPSLAGEAEAAARMGSMERLRALLHAIPGRKAKRALGIDPDDAAAVANYEREEKIQDELDKQERADRQRLKILPEELAIRDASENAQTAYSKSLEHNYRLAEQAAKGAVGAGAARRIRLDSGTGKWMQEDPATGVWSPVPGFKGGFKPQTVTINQVPHTWDPSTGIATPIKTQQQVAEEVERKAAEAEAEAEKKRVAAERAADREKGYLYVVRKQVRESLRLPGQAPADVGKKPVISTPAVKNPSQKPPAKHVLQQSDSAPGAGKITTEKKPNPLRRRKAASQPEPRRSDLAARLEIAARSRGFDLSKARQDGWSDDEIAATLGVE
jgi:hypothetical protein